MRSFSFAETILFRFKIGFTLCLIFAFPDAVIFAQTNIKARKIPNETSVKKVFKPSDLPKVTQVDAAALQKLIKREGANNKPLLVNFWATWCAPCIEEFPDLVKINDDYQGKIDFITISLDDLAEIETGVPQFLAKMKATMPTYLLKTDDETAAINSVYEKWQGGLPFTILYDGKGTATFTKQAKIVPAELRGEIDKLIVTK